jgi:DNA-binding response OmpR family regulator
MKILLVDDSGSARLLCRNKLTSLGIEDKDISEAPTLAAAKNLIRAVKYDIVLLDLAVPPYYGEETVNLMERAISESNRSTPIIVITDNADFELSKKLLMRKSIKNYITKDALSKFHLEDAIKYASYYMDPIAI